MLIELYGNVLWNLEILGFGTPRWWHTKDTEADGVQLSVAYISNILLLLNAFQSALGGLIIFVWLALLVMILEGFIRIICTTAFVSVI